MPDSLPAGLGGGGDGIGTAPSLSSLLTPSKEEAAAQQESLSESREARGRLKESADTATDLAKHLGEAPDPEKFGLSPNDLNAAKPTKPPEYKADNPLQDFGSIASLIGIFGGMRSRKPLVSSLNAAAGAMTAMKQSNLQDYDEKVKEWQNNVNFISKQMEWREKAYDIADKKFGNDLAAKSAAYQMISAASGDEMKAAQLAQGDWQGLAQSRKDSLKVMAQLEDTRSRLSESAQSHRDMMELRIDGAWQPPMEIKLKDGTTTQASQNKITRQWEYVGGKEINPTDIASEQRMAGTPRSAPAMFLQKYMQEHPKATAEDIASASAHYGAQVKAVSAFATGKQGDVLRSFETATQHLDTLDRLADALQNGDYRLFNSAAQAWARQTGNPAPTNFETARTIVGNEVVKSIVGAAGTGEDRDKAQAAFDAANSPQALHGAAQVIRDLMGGQMVGISDQYVDSGAGTEADFVNRLSRSPTALKIYQDARTRAMGGSSPNSAGPSSGSLPKEAQAQLKEGVHTTFGNGQVWTLKNGQPMQVQ